MNDRQERAAVALLVYGIAIVCAVFVAACESPTGKGSELRLEPSSAPSLESYTWTEPTPTVGPFLVPEGGGVR